MSPGPSSNSTHQVTLRPTRRVLLALACVFILVAPPFASGAEWVPYSLVGCLAQPDGVSCEVAHVGGVGAGVPLIGTDRASAGQTDSDADGLGDQWEGQF